MSESRKILVTGANGFVGDRVTRRLVAAGHEVRALVRRAGTAPDLGAAGREIVGDFTDEATAIAAADGVDAIVHCAATVGPDLESARHVNVTGTQSMLTAAERAAVRRFVHISTISVYELEGHARVDENSPYKTEGNAYGVSKAEGDELVLNAADRVPSVVLRPGAILGLHETSSWAIRVPEKIRSGEWDVSSLGLGNLPFLHVEDLVDAVELALITTEGVGQAFNVADYHGTLLDYANEVRRWFDLAPWDAPDPNAEDAPSFWDGIVTNDRIRDVLGYEAKRTYEEGMNEAAAHWREAASAPK